MANEAIELYKPWTPAKMTFPCIVQRKLDGVPARIRNLSGHIHAWSRQNEVITSIPQILIYAKYLTAVGGSFTGELHIEGMPFKDISGLVRKKVPTTETAKLILNVFDADILGKPETPYVDRMALFQKALANLAERAGKSPDDLHIRICAGVTCQNAFEAEEAFGSIMQNNPSAEGAVAHSLSKPYQPGTRRWDTQKIKPEPTIDLRIVSFEEALDKYKQPLDMVGRLNAEFTKLVDGKPVTYIIGVGPGSLTHAQRKVLWAKYKQGKYKTRIAEIKYMKDDTYEALRQPTFVRWRDDKDKPDGPL
jgi:ATP-dependent DNA ligase